MLLFSTSIHLPITVVYFSGFLNPICSPGAWLILFSQILLLLDEICISTSMVSLCEHCILHFALRVFFLSHDSFFGCILSVVSALFFVTSRRAFHRCAFGRLMANISTSLLPSTFCFFFSSLVLSTHLSQPVLTVLFFGTHFSPLSFDFFLCFVPTFAASLHRCENIFIIHHGFATC